MFLDRHQAGRELADALGVYRRAPGGLVLALPRGGVIVGAEISAALDFPLDVFISLKLRLPDFPEVALGAVTETGGVFLNREIQDSVCLPEGYLEGERAVRRAEVERRRLLYRGGRALPALKNRTVILVDDGVATGATFLAALQALRALGPRRLVAAVPVAPQSLLAALKFRCDELVVLKSPADFNAVGDYYAKFEPVADSLLVRVLKSATPALEASP